MGKKSGALSAPLGVLRFDVYRIVKNLGAGWVVGGSIFNALGKGDGCAEVVFAALPVAKNGDVCRASHPAAFIVKTLELFQRNYFPCQGKYQFRFFQVLLQGIFIGGAPNASPEPVFAFVCGDGLGEGRVGLGKFFIAVFFHGFFFQLFCAGVEGFIYRRGISYLGGRGGGDACAEGL